MTGLGTQLEADPARPFGGRPPRPVEPLNMSDAFIQSNAPSRYGPAGS